MKRRDLLVTLFFFGIVLLFSLNSISATQTYLNESSQWQSSLTKAFYTSLATADIDNDGDLDLVLTGCTATTGGFTCNSYLGKIYTNNGTSLIENSTWQQNLTAVNYGSLAFGDIDNDGDLDLALSGCNDGGGRIATCESGGYNARIYINNGTTFRESSQWQSNLTGNWKGTLAFGDIDNNGKLDLVMIGVGASGSFAKVYLNNGTSFVESSQWQQDLNAAYGSALALGDIDNDGDLDLGLTGDDGLTFLSKIYINNGTSFVENSDWQQDLTGMELSDIIFGDYDNDGDLDLSLTGHTSSDLHRIYRNNGSTFVEIQQEDKDLGGYYEGSQAFGDYDNDGDLDLITTGKEGHTFLYLFNTSSNNFTKYTKDPESHIVNIEDGSNAIWTDLDNDYDLDLIEIGFGGQSDNKEAYVYISNASLTKNNTQPNASSSSFSSTYSNNILTLGWGNGSDTETPTFGLYYNLMVGNSTHNHTIVSGVYGGSSNPTAGYFGNMMQRKNITLNLELESNKTYYWYVQTIDTGLAKSDWSAAQSFTTSLDTTKPNVTIENPSPSASSYTTNASFIFNATITDANLTNVTLYANWTGSMIANETNSSGINGTYTFTKNLTDKNDGIYNWYIYACDGDSNCQTSGTRSFYLDRAYPIITSISPASGSTLSSASVTFSYNVTDTDIANCSLIISGSVDQTDDSIIEDTTQNFTKTMSNGAYTWYVNCTDYVGYTNSSSTRSLTVSVSSGNGGSSGGGGGSAGTTGFWTAGTHAISDEQFSEGYTKELVVKSRMRVKVNNETHYVGVVNLTNTSVVINITSEPIQVVLGIGDDAKIDVLDDGFYDIYVLLNDINESKANLTIQSIYEEIPEGEGPVATSGEITNGEVNGVGDGEKKKRLWLYGLIGVGVVLVIAGIFFYLKKHLWKRELKKRRKNGRSKNR